MKGAVADKVDPIFSTVIDGRLSFVDAKPHKTSSLPCDD